MGDRYTLFYLQVTHGCDSVECNNKHCASNPRFSVPPNPEKKALQLASKSAAKVCMNMSPLVLYPKVQVQLHQFNMFADALIKGKKLDQCLLGYFDNALTNHDVFAHILLSKPGLLSPRDLLYSDEKLREFFGAFNRRFDEIGFKQSTKIFDYYDEYPNEFDGKNLKNIRMLLNMLLFEKYVIGRAHKIVSALLNINDSCMIILFSCLRRHQVLLQHILRTVRKSITFLIEKDGKEVAHSPEMYNFAAFIQLLFNINMESSNPLPSSSFYSSELSDCLIPEVEYTNFRDMQFSYLDIPVVLTMKFKNDVIYLEQEYFQKFYAGRYLGLLINRNRIIDDSLRQLIDREHHELKRRMRVEFLREPGLDTGGISREFVHLISLELFDSKNKLFKMVGYNTYWFNPECMSLKLYKLAGTICGLAIWNQVILPVRLLPCVFKKILGLKVGLSDLAAYNKEYTDSLRGILDVNESKEDVSSLCLSFTTPDGDNLFPNGSETPVTNANCVDYVNMVCDYYLNTSVKDQFEHFRAGFLNAFQSPVNDILSPDEINILLSGEDKYDWDSFKQATTYDETSSGYTKDSETIVNMWKVFDSFDEKTKCKWLLFVTGNAGSPVGGFSNAKIRITRSADDHLLPTAHTCSRTLVMPDYKDENKIRKSMLLCCEFSQGVFLV